MNLHRVHFLIVDDNIHAIDLVKTLLRGFGVVQFSEAQTIDEAKRRLNLDAIDIVILDYLMGDEEGISLVKYLRTDPESPAPYVPIIMLSGHADRARVIAARDVGADEFCVKPVTPTDMLKRIANVIDHPRPFIRCDGYSGPDRRRGDDPRYKGVERRRVRPT